MRSRSVNGLKPGSRRAESESVTAAHVTWRPLGALLVEKGLLTAEELEEALAAQQTTGKRLGQILVDRGRVSGPALTNALAEQHGIEPREARIAELEAELGTHEGRLDEPQSTGGPELSPAAARREAEEGGRRR